jgi:methyltransferase (TIGR00027 family)
MSTGRFEIDHPATQQWKRQRLADAHVSIPPNATFVPVDFEKTTVKAALPEAGFDPTASAFFSMLGVSQYLTEEALDETLDVVRTTGSSSEIVFSFVPPDDALPEDEAALTIQFASSASEALPPPLDTAPLIRAPEGL